MRPRPEAALALIRVVAGLVFAWHGFHKIFELGLGSMTADYRAAGVPLPLLVAPLLAVLELVGGPLLALGLGARGLAAGLALMTALVAAAPLWTATFWAAKVNLSSLEAPLLLIIGSLAVALGGPGSPALRDRSGPVLPPARILPGRKRG